MYEGIVLSAILLPLLLSSLPFLLKGRGREMGALFASSLTFFLTLFLLPRALEGGVFFGKELIYGLSLSFEADALSVFVASSTSLLGVLVVLFSVEYMRRYGSPPLFYFLSLLLTGGMMGLVFSANLILFYVFWEITAVCAWRLIGIANGEARGDKAFLITFAGSAFFVLGLVLLYLDGGSLDLPVLKGRSAPSIALLFMLFGIISRSAQVPLHSWLLDAGVAPAPVSALINAAFLVNTGVYAFARIFCFTFHMPPVWRTVVPVIAIAGSLLCGFAAIAENDMRRILSYSTVGEMGYILIGLSAFTQPGVMGALFYILVHGLGKGGLILSLGVVESETGETDIRRLGGLFRTMPLVGVVYLLCAFSIMGLPPFGGFFSKLWIIMGAWEAGMSVVTGLLILSAFLTMVYLMRLFYAVFLGEPFMREAREKGRLMLSSIALSGALSFIMGIIAFLPHDILRVACEQISGMAR